MKTLKYKVQVDVELRTTIEVEVEAETRDAACVEAEQMVLNGEVADFDASRLGRIVDANASCYAITPDIDADNPPAPNPIIAGGRYWTWRKEYDSGDWNAPRYMALCSVEFALPVEDRSGMLHRYYDPVYAMRFDDGTTSTRCASDLWETKPEEYGC